MFWRFSNVTRILVVLFFSCEVVSIYVCLSGQYLAMAPKYSVLTCPYIKTEGLLFLRRSFSFLKLFVTVELEHIILLSGVHP